MLKKAKNMGLNTYYFLINCISISYFNLNHS